MAEAFTPRQMDAIDTAMDKIIAKIITPMKLVLTEQEFIDGFIYPDHLPVLQEHTKLTGSHSPQGSFSFTAHSAAGEELTLARNADLPARMMFPTYVKQGLRPDAPVEIRQRLNDWINNRIMLSDAMRDVHAAINNLTYAGFAARAIRTIVPCLPLVVSMMYYSDTTNIRAESSVKAADKLARATGSGGLPMLSREIKQRLHEASSIITSHFALMNEQPAPTAPTAPPYGFTCWLASRSNIQAPVLGRCSKAY